MYRVALESLLGFTKNANTLRIDPCVPAHWPGFQLSYRLGRTTYVINVRNPARFRERGIRVSVDGDAATSDAIELVDDGRTHYVTVDAAAPAGVEVQSPG